KSPFATEGSVTMGIAVQLSVAVGAVQKTVAPEQSPGSFTTLMFPGQSVNVGASSSSIVTSKLQVVTLPWTSVTVQITVVVPTGYVPDASEVPLKSLVTLATPQLSAVAGAAIVRAALQAPASAVWDVSLAHPIDGASSSSIVTSKLHVVTLPWVSVTVQSTVVVPTG